MNTDLLRQVRALDPASATDDLPEGVWSAAVVLQTIDERTGTVQTQEREISRNVPEQKPPRFRPIWVAAAAFAAVIVLGVVLLLAPGGDDAAPVAPTTTAPTTVAPTTVAPTTLPPSTVDPTADPAALDVVSQLGAAFEAGDMVAAERLFHPDGGYFTGDMSAGVSREIWYRYATNMTMESECVLGTPADFTAGVPDLAGGTIVICDDVIISGLETGATVGGGRVAFEVFDGLVFDMFIFPGYVGALEETSGLDAYRSWLRERRPEQFDELFAFGVNVRLDTSEQRESHREWSSIFVAATGPRSAPSLPADTPFIDVVRIFGERWDAGDVAGYEAIFFPLTGYESGSDAPTSWFVSVTGITTERDCEVVDANQVRCTETSFSGLLPGRSLGTITTLYTGGDGWIWTIDFPNGIPETLTDQAASPGVPEYRAWLAENDPEALAELFGGETMRIHTEELREAHKAAIAEYLAATTG